MTREEVLNYFGNVSKIAKIVGKTASAISQWEKNGIPADCQRMFYYISYGELRPSSDIPYISFRKLERIRRIRDI